MGKERDLEEKYQEGFCCEGLNIFGTKRADNGFSSATLVIETRVDGNPGGFIQEPHYPFESNL